MSYDQKVDEEKRKRDISKQWMVGSRKQPPRSLGLGQLGNLGRKTCSLDLLCLGHNLGHIGAPTSQLQTADMQGVSELTPIIREGHVFEDAMCRQLDTHSRQLLRFPGPAKPYLGMSRLSNFVRPKSSPKRLNKRRKNLHHVA